MGKVDYQINSQQSFFGRFLSAKLNQSSTYDGKNPLSINNYGINDLDYGLALGHTWVVNPNVVNSLHIGVNRTNVLKLNDNYKSFADLGANVSPLAGSIISLNRARVLRDRRPGRRAGRVTQRSAMVDRG